MVLRELLHREVRFREDPRFTGWRTQYRVARAGLHRLLQVPESTLDGAFAELLALRPGLVAELADRPKGGAMMQAPLLYVLTRVAKPSVVVETGVASGYSARFVLEAMARNGTGTLHSIGIPQLAIDAQKAGGSEAIQELASHRIGWLVPDPLRSRWTIHEGMSQAVLPPLLDGLSGPIDAFVHDSFHDYPTMTFEYGAAWPHLAPGGLLLSHDIHNNSAWREFVGKHGVERDEELDHDLGVAVRPSDASSR